MLKSEDQRISLVATSDEWRLSPPASAAEIRSLRGEVLASIPTAELEKRVWAPGAAVHRADLQALLAREAGEGTLRLDAEVEAFEQHNRRVTASEANPRLW